MLSDCPLSKQRGPLAEHGALPLPLPLRGHDPGGLDGPDVAKVGLFNGSQARQRDSGFLGRIRELLMQLWNDVRASGGSPIRTIRTYLVKFWKFHNLS